MTRNQDKLYVRSGYMSDAHNSFPELVRRARAELAGVEFDTLVGTGLSGAIVVPDLARRLRKNFLLIRKDGDGSHSYQRGEGTLGRRWLFVDDFIDTGDTRDRVKVAVADIAARHIFHTDYVGAYLYRDKYYSGPEDD